MKLPAILLLLFTLCYAPLSGQTGEKELTAEQVPPVVIQTFNTKFPDAQRCLWSLQAGKVYKAFFYEGTKPLAAFFDSTGKFTGYMAYGKREAIDSVFKQQVKVMMH